MLVFKFAIRVDTADILAVEAEEAAHLRDDALEISSRPGSNTVLNNTPEDGNVAAILRTERDFGRSIRSVVTTDTFVRADDTPKLLRQLSPYGIRKAPEEGTVVQYKTALHKTDNVAIRLLVSVVRSDSPQSGSKFSTFFKALHVVNVFFKMSKWLEEFLKRPSSQYFVTVEKEFMADSFNSFGLTTKMSHFSEAISLILRGTYKKNTDKEIIEQQAVVLYGMMHQRYLETGAGIAAMRKKYKTGKFAKCPRVYCKNVSCLPFGVSSQPGEYSMKLYCPSCNDVYNMKDPTFSHVDGAYFGPSYVHMYMQEYPSDEYANKHFVPSIFGFKICDESEVHVKESEE